MSFLVQYLVSRWHISAADSTVASLYFNLETLKTGDHLVVEGQEISRVGIIMNGILKAVGTPVQGAPIYHFSLENEWAGDLQAFEDAKKSTTSICAATDCHLATISYPKFREAYDQHAFFRAGWAAAKRSLALKTPKSEYDQEDPKSRYENFIRNEPELAIKLTTEDIASYLKMPHTKLLHILFEMVLFS